MLLHPITADLIRPSLAELPIEVRIPIRRGEPSNLDQVTLPLGDPLRQDIQLSLVLPGDRGAAGGEMNSELILGLVLVQLALSR